MLLGVALERACGQDYRAYIRQNIFKPLGMTSAGFLDDKDAWGESFPLGYGRASAEEALFLAPRWKLGAAMYTGGIYANASDLARFCAAFMQTPSPILDAESIQRMIHPAAMGDTHLGWWKGWHAGHSNFGHAGAHVGYISAGLFVPSHHLAVAVQTNRWNPVFDSNDSTQIARELIADLIPTLESLRPVFNPADVDLTGYEGVYRLPGDYASIEVTHQPQSKNLRLALQGDPPEIMEVALLAPHQFGPPGSVFPAVTFEANSSGEITRLSYALFQFYRSA
jgi:CubicO group peptidase (beta-lactamase class C family)